MADRFVEPLKFAFEVGYACICISTHICVCVYRPTLITIQLQHITWLRIRVHTFINAHLIETLIFSSSIVLSLSLLDLH